MPQTLLKLLKYYKVHFLTKKPLQHTSLDLQCVCDSLQNCPFLLNFMYILHEFCTFPVTEGNKKCKKYKFPAFLHPESHKFLRPHNYSQLETRGSSKINPEICEFQANALIDPCKIVINKESILQNFALFALCTHFQDHSSITAYM